MHPSQEALGVRGKTRQICHPGERRVPGKPPPLADARFPLPSVGPVHRHGHRRLASPVPASPTWGREPNDTGRRSGRKGGNQPFPLFATLGAMRERPGEGSPQCRPINSTSGVAREEIREETHPLGLERKAYVGHHQSAAVPGDHPTRAACNDSKSACSSRRSPVRRSRRVFSRRTRFGSIRSAS